MILYLEKLSRTEKVKLHNNYPCLFKKKIVLPLRPEGPYLLYSSVMDIMLNNTDITLQLSYKTLDLDGFCMIHNTMDNEHSLQNIVNIAKTVL